MNQDRRDILKNLGIIVAGAGVVSTEALAMKSADILPEWPPACPLLPKHGSPLQSSIADALEAMAESIRQREVIATELAVHSTLKPNEDWLNHTVTIHVEVPLDAARTREEWPPNAVS